jgi:hypothetical protein
MPKRRGAGAAPHPPKTDPIRTTIQSDWSLLMSEITTIPKPIGSTPVVTLSEASFPIVLGHLADSAGFVTNVVMPFMGGALVRPGNGHLLCVGNLSFFTATSQQSAHLIQNLVRWAAGNSSMIISICVLELPPEQAEHVRKGFKARGFEVVVRENASNIGRFQVIFCLSDSPHMEILDEKLRDGGAVFCVPASPDAPNRFRLNPMLARYGLGFVSCALDFGPCDAKVFEIAREPDFEHGFPALAEKFISLIDTDATKVDIGVLDSLVATLVFHIGVLPREENELLRALVESTQRVLETLGYDSEEGFCTSTLHALLMAVLSDAIGRMPAPFFTGVDRSKMFPGPFRFPDPGDHSVVVDLTWTGEHSTGCYIAPGVLGSCHFLFDDTSALSIQIGSHSESLLEASGPWLRWPFASTTFEVSTPDVDIAWMLGGIIYLVNTAPLGKVSIELNNVSKCGVFRGGKWVTPYNSAPFCEIVTEMAVLTVPSALISDIDVNNVCERFDDLIGMVVDFVGAERDLVFRFVFDVQLPDHETVFGNPTFLEYEHFKPVVVDDEPSPPMFSVLMFIGTMCFPPEMWSEDDVACLGFVAAGLAFATRWNDVSVLDQAIALGADFQVFWERVAALSDPTVVTLVLRRLRASPPKTPVETWNALLDDLSAETGVAFNADKKAMEEVEHDDVTEFESAQSLDAFAFDPPRK